MNAQDCGGRGGGGFPSGTKWRLALLAEGPRKFVICNAAEGDPGAFMDRAVLQGNPHSVIEGMIIAAYAVGAREGYIYLRADYPLAIQRITTALDQAGELGLLGENILGTGFDLHIRLFQGAGAFVCGEETVRSRRSKAEEECHGHGRRTRPTVVFSVAQPW